MILDNNFFCNVFTSAKVYFGLNNLVSDVVLQDKLCLFFKDKDIFVSIDSRTATAQDIFLALKGPSFDGHDFLVNALEKVVCGIIINKSKIDLLHVIPQNLLNKKLIIIVDDPYKTLIEMAKYWRSCFDIPVVGVTGSIGKTTTKEMIDSILNASQITHFVSYKNQNNQIGLPLNILRLKKEDKMAVFELGINDAGEMDFLVDILRPTIAVITTVAHVHTEGLGSLAGVAREKRQIFKHFGTKNIGIIFGDNDLLNEFAYTHPVVRFGFKRKNNIRASKIKLASEGDNNFVEFVLDFYGRKYTAKLNTDNEILVHNALAAAAVCNVLGIDCETIIAGLQNFKSVSGRFEKKALKNNKGFAIDDCYNASPESMKKSILAFDKIISKGPKIAVLGDMLELGSKESFWHRQIGRVLCKTSNIDELVLVGSLAKLIASTAPLNMKINLVENWQEAELLLQKLLTKDSLVLLKASHGMGFANIINKLS